MSDLVLHPDDILSQDVAHKELTCLSFYTCTPYIIQGFLISIVPKQHVHTTGIHENVIYTNCCGRSTDFTLRMICKNREY